MRSSIISKALNSRFFISAIALLYTLLFYIQKSHDIPALLMLLVAIFSLLLLRKSDFLYKHTPKKLQEQEESAIARLDKDFNITYASKSFVQLLGIEDGNIFEIYQNCTNHSNISDHILQKLNANISFNDMIEIRHGKKISYIDTFIKKLDNSSISRNKYVVICKDITRYIESELQLKNQLLLDTLTSLPTRLKLLEDIDKTPKTRSKHAHTLIYIQVEPYEQINEYFGVEMGYELLKSVSSWLQSNLPTKNSTLYKFEHSSFAIYISTRIDLSDLESYLKRINHQIQKENFMIDGSNYEISLTMGVARGRKDLLRNSYIALNDAKRRNRSFTIYNKNQYTNKKFIKNLQKNRDIRDAINEDRVVPFFQPILNIKTDKVEKFESLMRIQNLDNTHQAPAEFLEIAQKSKLYPDLTKAMINASLKRIDLLMQPITINISIGDITNPKISSFIIRKLDKYPNSNLITFEILESEQIENYKKVANFIKKIKSFGCKIAIDDFGSGYSNFEQILKLDIDYIKIDGSLIKDILTNKESEIVIKTIINFAKELGVKTIAEFVSNKEIFEKVKDLGINYAQGYYIGKPAPITLAKSKPHPSL